MTPRRLFYISGTRADYSPMRSVLLAISRDQAFDLAIIPTGMHLRPEHGRTIDLILRDGLTVVGETETLGPGDTPADMVLGLARLLPPLADLLSRERPDAVMVTGDRGEALAGAICGAHLDLPVIHFCGGSISGSIDDSIRHATTRFAHLHFAATEESLRNLVRMGEDPAACFLVGLPGADLRADATLTHEEVERALGFQLGDRYVVVIQHPVTHEYREAPAQMATTLEAVSRFGLPVVACLPNSDSGGRAMAEVVRRHAATNTLLRFVDNLPRPVFASLVAGCACLVGNSSSGLGEAVSLGIPVVNIGTRQRGRERMGNAVDVGYDATEIAEAVGEALLASPAGAAKAAGAAAAPGSRDRPNANAYLFPDTEKRVVKLLKTLDLRSFVPKRPLWSGRDKPGGGSG